MKQWMRILLPVFLSITLWGCSQVELEPPGPPLVPQEQIGTDNMAVYRDALAKAQSENKAVFVMFTAPEWCGPCKQMERKVVETDTFKEYVERRLVLVTFIVPRGKPETDAEKLTMEMADLMKIDGVPTLIMTTPDGREIMRRSYGGSEADSFVKFLESRIKRTGALQ